MYVAARAQVIGFWENVPYAVKKIIYISPVPFVVYLFVLNTGFLRHMDALKPLTGLRKDILSLQ